MEEASRKISSSNRDKSEYKKKYEFFGQTSSTRASIDSYTVENLTELSSYHTIKSYRESKKHKNTKNVLTNQHQPVILKITKKPPKTQRHKNALQLKTVRMVIKDLRHENLREILKNNKIRLGSASAVILKAPKQSAVNRECKISDVSPLQIKIKKKDSILKIKSNEGRYATSTGKKVVPSFKIKSDKDSNLSTVVPKIVPILKINSNSVETTPIESKVAFKLQSKLNKSGSEVKSILKSPESKVTPLRVKKGLNKEFEVTGTKSVHFSLKSTNHLNLDQKLFKRFKCKQFKLKLNRIDSQLNMGPKKTINLKSAVKKSIKVIAKPKIETKVKSKSPMETIKSAKPSEQIKSKVPNEQTKTSKLTKEIKPAKVKDSNKVIKDQQKSKEKNKTMPDKNNKLTSKTPKPVKTNPPDKSAKQKSEIPNKKKKVKQIIPPSTKSRKKHSHVPDVEDDTDLEMVASGKLPSYLENNELSLLVPLKTKVIKPQRIVPPKIIELLDPKAPKQIETSPKLKVKDLSALQEESPRLKLKELSTLQKEPKLRIRNIETMKEVPKPVEPSHRVEELAVTRSQAKLKMSEEPKKDVSKRRLRGDPPVNEVVEQTKKIKKKDEDQFWSPFEYVEVRSIKAPATLVEEVFPLPVIPPPIPIPAVPEDDLPQIQSVMSQAPVEPNVMVKIQPMEKAKNSKRKVKYPTNRDVKRVRYGAREMVKKAHEFLAMQTLPDTDNDFQITSVWSDATGPEVFNIDNSPRRSPVVDQIIPDIIPIEQPVPVGSPIPANPSILAQESPIIPTTLRSVLNKSKKGSKSKKSRKPPVTPKEVKEGEAPKKPKRRFDIPDPAPILEGKRTRKKKEVNYAYDNEEFLDALLESQIMEEKQADLAKYEREKVDQEAEEERHLEEVKKLAESFITDKIEEKVAEKTQEKAVEKSQENLVEKSQENVVEEESGDKDLKLDDLPPTPSPRSLLSLSIDNIVEQVVQDCAVSSSSSTNTTEQQITEPKIPKLKLKLKKSKKRSSEKSEKSKRKKAKKEKKREKSKFDLLLSEGKTQPKIEKSEKVEKEMPLPKLKININKDGETKLVVQHVSVKPKKKVKKEEKPSEEVKKEIKKPVKKTPTKIKLPFNDKFQKLLEDKPNPSKPPMLNPASQNSSGSSKTFSKSLKDKIYPPKSLKEDIKPKIVLPPPKPKTPPPPPKPKEPKPVTPESVAEFFSTNIKKLSELNKNCNWGGIYEQAAYHFFDTTLNYYRNYLFTYWKNNTGGIQQILVPKLRSDQLDINVNVENLFDAVSPDEDAMNYITRVRQIEKVVKPTKASPKPEVKPAAKIEPIQKEEDPVNSPKVSFQNSPLNLSDPKPIEKENTSVLQVPTTSVLQVPEVSKYSSLASFYNNAQNLLDGDSLSNRSSTEEIVKDQIVIPQYSKVSTPVSSISAIPVSKTTPALYEYKTKPSEGIKFLVTNIENVQKEPQYQYKALEIKEDYQRNKLTSPGPSYNMQQRITSPTPTYTPVEMQRVSTPVYNITQTRITSPPPQTYHIIQQPATTTTYTITQPTNIQIVRQDSKPYEQRNVSSPFVQQQQPQKITQSTNIQIVQQEHKPYEQRTVSSPFVHQQQQQQPQKVTQATNIQIVRQEHKPYEQRNISSPFVQQQQTQKVVVTTQGAQQPREYQTYTEGRNYYNYATVVTASQPTNVITIEKPKTQPTPPVEAKKAAQVTNFYYDMSKTYSQLQPVRPPTPEQRPVPKPPEKEPPKPILETPKSSVPTATTDRITEFQQPYFLNNYYTTSYLRTLENSLLAAPNILLQTTAPSTSTAELFPTEVINQHYSQPQNHSYSGMDNYMINCNDSQSTILLPNEALMQTETNQNFTEITESYSPTLLTLNTAATQEYQQQQQQESNAYAQWEKTQPSQPKQQWAKEKVEQKQPVKERSKFTGGNKRDDSKNVITLQLEHSKLFNAEGKFAKNYTAYLKEEIKRKYPYCTLQMGNTRQNKLGSSKIYMHCTDKSCVRFSLTVSNPIVDAMGLTPVEIKVCGVVNPENQKHLRMQQIDTERLLVE